jgi:DNA/RNA-binding domain of Phe-tRNA-synthetase-like protein
MTQWTVDAAMRSLHSCWIGKIEWADVNVEVGSQIWLEELQKVSSELKEAYSEKDSLDNLEAVRATRNAYQSYGVNPKRYPPASEALVKRVLGGKMLPLINSVVDLNNVLSLRTLYPVGSYNSNSIRGNVQLRVGKPGESYKAIGSDEYNAEGFPTLFDDLGPFGGASRDSQRAMVSPGVTTVTTIIYAFHDPRQSHIDEMIAKCLDRAKSAGVGTPGHLEWIS